MEENLALAAKQETNTSRPERAQCMQHNSLSHPMAWGLPGAGAKERKRPGRFEGVRKVIFKLQK